MELQHNVLVHGIVQMAGHFLEHLVIHNPVMELGLHVHIPVTVADHSQERHVHLHKERHIHTLVHQGVPYQVLHVHFLHQELRNMAVHMAEV
jgi:hypothetical protein